MFKADCAVWGDFGRDHRKARRLSCANRTNEVNLFEGDLRLGCAGRPSTGLIGERAAVYKPQHRRGCLIITHC